MPADGWRIDPCDCLTMWKCNRLTMTAVEAGKQAKAPTAPALLILHQLYSFERVLLAVTR